VAVAILSAVRDHLFAKGIVRKPTVPGSLPPMWVEPMQGLRGPKKPGEPATTEDSTDLVLGAFLTGGIAPGRFESWWRQPIIDVRYRGWSVPTIEATELLITKALADRVDFMLAPSTPSATYSVEGEQWRALQRLGSDEQGYEYVSAYRFVLYRP
jgi:hypothetical protein